MATAVIDTLRYAEKLERGGVEHSTANEMAHALNAELADHVPTKADLEQRSESMENSVDAMEVKFDARFDAMDAKWNAMETKFEARWEAMEARFDAMDARCDAIEAKFDARCDAMEAKFEARFDAMDAKIESLASALKVTNAMMILGFGLLGTLGIFQLAKDPSPVAAPVAIERPAAPNAPPVELPP